MGFVTLGFFIAFRHLGGRGCRGRRHGAVGRYGADDLARLHIGGAVLVRRRLSTIRLHSRNIADYGGVVNTMPVFAAFMLLFAMANCGLPGTSGFVGEFLVILASFKANFWFAALAGLTLILGAAYSLWMYKRVIFGDVANDNVAALKDFDCRETGRAERPGDCRIVIRHLAGRSAGSDGTEPGEPSNAHLAIQAPVSFLESAFEQEFNMNPSAFAAVDLIATLRPSWCC